MAEVRCLGCGKRIENGAKAYRIAQGSLGGSEEGVEFEERKVFGHMDETCFKRTVTSPSLVLAELRRLDKKKK